MLSSVVNSLTYRVLSHLFFTYLWQFFSNLYILLWQKNYEICRLFWWNMTQLWLVLFAFTFGALFGKNLLSMQCLVPKSAKMCIFWDFLAWFCTVLLWDFFTYFFELFITCFVHFFFKNHVFSCFSENNNYHDFPFRHCIVHDRMMVICTSLWKLYLNVSLFFVENVIILYALLFTYFV